MKKAKLFKIASPFLALALVLSFVLVAAPQTVSAQATLDVPGLYPTIQEAVNAASPGDTIRVAAETYDEQVVINKSLTLQGAGDGTIIQPSSADILTHIVVGMPWIGGTKNFAGIIVVDGVADVTVKNLQVDGVNVDSAPEASVWVAGILYSKSSGVIDGVTVVNMEMDTSDRTNGIYLSADATAAVSVEVKNCTVDNYNRGGIYGFGNALTVNIHDNTVIGPGELAAANVPNGIMLLNGVNGTVGPNNTVSNHVYTPPTYAATGISLWDVDGVTVESNTVTNCELGIALTGYTGSVGNTIQNNTLDGNPRAGVFMETPGTTDNEITGNTITNNAHGIEVMGSLAPTYDPGEEAGPDNVANFNDIVGNTQYGVVNLNPGVTFDATNNWWGDGSGPSGVGVGSGDAVSGYVAYAPWLQEYGALVTEIPETIKVEVSPAAIDFGIIPPGESSYKSDAARTLTLTNTGNMETRVTTTIANEDPAKFYTDNMTLKDFDELVDPPGPGEMAAVDYSRVINVGEEGSPLEANPIAQIYVPEAAAAGTRTGTIVFWAALAVVHDLTMGKVGNGTVDPDVGVYTYPGGKTISITATPDSGWGFAMWSSDGVNPAAVADPYSPSTTVTMDADKTVIAVFFEYPNWTYAVTYDVPPEAAGGEYHDTATKIMLPVGMYTAGTPISTAIGDITLDEDCVMMQVEYDPYPHRFSGGTEVEIRGALNYVSVANKVPLLTLAEACLVALGDPAGLTDTVITYDYTSYAPAWVWDQTTELVPALSPTYTESFTAAIELDGESNPVIYPIEVDIDGSPTTFYCVKKETTLVASTAASPPPFGVVKTDWLDATVGIVQTVNVSFDGVETEELVHYVLAP